MKTEEEPIRQALRALGWITTILWISVMAFGFTVAYSVTNLRADIGHPQILLSNGLITITLPFFINNTGFYDISELSVTTSMKDYNGSLLSTSTTLVPVIPPDSAVEKIHNVSISLDYLTQNLSYMLLNDGDLIVDARIAMTLAHAIPLWISTDMTIRWGAPLYNFSIGEISFNLITQKTIVPLSFENHSPFSINGTMRLEIYNGNNEWLGSGTTQVIVPPNSVYKDKIEVSVDVSKLTEKGNILLYFESPAFCLGPITLGW